MSKRAWLSTSHAKNPDAFGEFHQCHAFESSTQSTNCSSMPIKRAIGVERDVVAYLDDLEKTQPDICIIALMNRTAANNGKLPLPVSQPLFDRIVTLFNLAPSFLRVLGTGLTVFTSSIPANCKKDKLVWENAQFVIQQNRAYSAFSIALTFNNSTRKIRALIFGAEASVVSDMFELLACMPTHLYGPMVIPAVAMELQAQWFTDTVRNLQDQVHSIETLTGMRQFNFPHEVKGSGSQDWKTLDLISIARDLSSLLSRFAFLKMQAETGTYLVDRMRQITELFMAQLENNHAKEGQDGMASDQASIMSNLEEAQSWYLGLAARCRYLSERASAQNQTVYCLIASQYNLAGVELAQTSCNIAEETRKENKAMRTISEIARHDNELMIQVAKDSRRIAIATARDSAAMQVIAAVTILFLPATFTATFFSMTFFDFSNAAKPGVSPWTWIYAVVTGTVTILIQSTWVIMSRKKKAKVTKGILSS
ncbi:hypothetical protein F5B18DRAFT_640021 [Nemania serpens]|nr:hypothetical protein F5B18DRAFT_640021 [Nemania serpens]